MKERGQLSLAMSGTTYLEDGTKVVTQEQRKKSTRKASNTAVHEVKHSFVAEKLNPGSVKLASIIPGPGYLGITEVTKMHAAAAAAPDAHGMSGTGHDLNVVERMGSSLSSARSVARGVMSGKEDVIYETACDLEEKGTMSGSEIRSSIYEAENGKEVIIFLMSPDGQQQEFTEYTTDNIIQFPTKKISFQEAA